MNIHGWYIIFLAVIIALGVGGMAWWIHLISKKKSYREE